MKWLFVFWLVIGLGSTARAQESYSLNTMADSSLAADTARIKEWMALGDKYIVSRLDSAFLLLRQAYALSEKRGLENYSVRIL
jgi:hypothetical protein